MAVFVIHIIWLAIAPGRATSLDQPSNATTLCSTVLYLCVCARVCLCDGSSSPEDIYVDRNMRILDTKGQLWYLAEVVLKLVGSFSYL